MSSSHWLSVATFINNSEERAGPIGGTWLDTVPRTEDDQLHLGLGHVPKCQVPSPAGAADQWFFPSTFLSLSLPCYLKPIKAHLW